MKKLFCVFLIFIVAFTFVACSSSSEMDKKALEEIQKKVLEDPYIESIETVEQLGKKDTDGMVEYRFAVTYINSKDSSKYNSVYLLYVTPTKDNKDFITYTYFPETGSLEKIS